MYSTDELNHVYRLSQHQHMLYKRLGKCPHETGAVIVMGYNSALCVSTSIIYRCLQVAIRFYSLDQKWDQLTFLLVSFKCFERIY